MEMHPIVIDLRLDETDGGRPFLSERVVADWNSISDDAVTAPSVSCCKARLEAHRKNLQSIFELVSLWWWLFPRLRGLFF